MFFHGFQARGPFRVPRKPWKSTNKRLSCRRFWNSPSSDDWFSKLIELVFGDFYGKILFVNEFFVCVQMTTKSLNIEQAYVHIGLVRFMGLCQ